MAIYGQALTVNMYAYNVNTNQPATGLAASISGYIIKDGGVPAVLNGAITEPSGAIMPGIYEVPLTAGEMQADWITIGGSVPSNTGVVLYPVMVATESSYLPNISGYTDSLEAGQTTIQNQNDAIAVSGQGWTTATGFSTQAHVDAAADRVIASGNAGWTTADLTGTNTKIDEVAVSGQGWVTADISNLPEIDEIVTSGNAAGWGASSSLTLEGIASEVASSGNAEGWNSYDSPAVIASAVTSSGTAAGWGSTADVGLIVTGIFDEVVNGSKSYRDAFEEIWAYAANSVGVSGSSPFSHQYYDMADAKIYKLNVSGQGRTRI
jgi:hypothetical protein